MSYLNSPRGSPPKAGGGCHPGSTPSPPRLVGVGQSPASVHGLDLASLSPAQSPLRGVDHRQKEHFLKPEENPTQIALDSNPKRGVQSFPTFPLLFFIVWRKVFLSSLLSVNQVASILQVSTRTIRNLVSRGHFPGARRVDPSLPKSPYQIPEKDVQEYVKKQGVQQRSN